MRLFNNTKSLFKLVRNKTDKTKCVVYDGVWHYATNGPKPLAASAGIEYDGDHEQQSRILMDFGDYKSAFRTKSKMDLMRSLLVMRLCSYEFLVNRSISIIDAARRIAGRTLVDGIVRPTVYKQFVGGAERDEIASCVAKIRAAGIGVLFAVPIEEDVQHSSGDEWHNTSVSVILRSMDLACEFGRQYPMIQMRVTALVPAEILATLSQQKADVLDEELVQHFVECLQSKTKAKVGCLSEEQNEGLNKGIQRLSLICDKSQTSGVRVWVDAEYTYVNPAINALVLAMAICNNGKRPRIAYTYQCYLKNTYDVLRRDIEFLKSRRVKFAAKLVRGAYMVKERLLAKERGYEDPLNENWEATNDMYDKSMDMILREIAGDPSGTAVILATHNETSVLKAISTMSELGIKTNQVMFGQLYGMCDHVSYSLGHSGYLVYKSIPYGNIDQTLPYLSRRAQENRAVLAGIRRERSLLWKALRHKIVTLKRTSNIELY